AVAGRGVSAGGGLRNDRAGRDLPACQAARAPRGLLARIDREQAGADDLAHVRRFVQRQRNERREERREPRAREERRELWERVPDEQELEQRRRRPEDPVVEEHERANRAEAALSPEREEEADHNRRAERRARQPEREQRSPPVRTGGERYPEDVRVEARKHELATVLLDVRDRNLVLVRDLDERAVGLQLRHTVLDLRAERRRVSLAVVDPERVLRRECEADRDLVGMLLRL